MNLVTALVVRSQQLTSRQWLYRTLIQENIKNARAILYYNVKVE